MRSAIKLIALFSVSVAVTATAKAADRVTNCRHDAGPTITITSVRNMSCARAAKVIVTGDQKVISRHFEPGHGFSCDRVSGGRFGGEWRCVKSNGKAFRFDFAD